MGLARAFYLMTFVGLISGCRATHRAFGEEQAGASGAAGSDESLTGGNAGSTDSAAGEGGSSDNAGASGDNGIDGSAGTGGSAGMGSAAGHGGMGGVTGMAGAEEVGGSAGAAGTGMIGRGSSCVALASSCGPQGNRDCCESNIVPGGTFNRSSDVNSPATVSDFRLDTYEVTVGRFRKFVAAYSQNMIAKGAGKNPNNPDDKGWNDEWNDNLETTASTLASALKCNSTQQTWTDDAVSAVGESLPIDCVNWYEAAAFCIWDGGRLPTEAEWNYAASGGAEQRAYPWSNPPSSTAIDATYAVYNGVKGVAVVGSKSPKGDGKWGQSDLAGNILEWVQDFYVTPYPVPCTNCAALNLAPNRMLRGGGFTFDASNQLTSYRNGGSAPFGNGFFFGVRCARSAP